MRDSLECPKPPPALLEGRHVLAMLIAFFAVILGVNGYFLVSALRTHSGIVAIEPYRKGLAYNARIAAGDRQSALGWRETVTVTRNGTVSVRISDHDGIPVPGLAVTGVLGRPSTSGNDRLLQLREDDGRYIAVGSELADGSWIVSVEARISIKDAEPVYRARRRIWLKP